jgi:hypothetical protein
VVRRKYHRLFSSHLYARKLGPKGPNDELIRAIVELKSRNPRFGCHRNTLIIYRTFSVNIDKNVVRRVLSKHYREPPRGTGPSWLTFIGHAKDSLWSADLLRCESTLLQSVWVLVVMDQFTRRIVGFGIQRGAVDGPALCRVFNDATIRKVTPRHISTEHDPLFEFHRWRANLRTLDIDEVKTVPNTRTSHPFVERLIGTTRREFVDHTLFWNTLDLERKLEEFRTYYNSERVHSSINGNTPNGLASGQVVEAATPGAVCWHPYCRGLDPAPRCGMTNEFETDTFQEPDCAY